MNTSKRLKVAILDLNEGEPNEGMRCLRNILSDFGEENNIKVERLAVGIRCGSLHGLFTNKKL